MDPLTRREVMLRLATCAAGISGARTFADENTGSVTPGASTAADARAQIRDRVLALEMRPERLSNSRIANAEVWMVRSWNREVYLCVDDDFRGLVALNEPAHAIAAACHAANRKVAVEVWGHSPEWGGVGRFEGARLAMDIQDFPDSRPVASSQPTA